MPHHDEAVVNVDVGFKKGFSGFPERPGHAMKAGIFHGG
jgi:hypothetical protein